MSDTLRDVASILARSRFDRAVSDDELAEQVLATAALHGIRKTTPKKPKTEE